MVDLKIEELGCVDGHLNRLNESSRVRGVIEIFDRGILKGWCADLDEPGNNMALSIYFGSLEIGRINCDRARNDILLRIPNIATPGFQFDLTRLKLEDSRALLSALLSSGETSGSALSLFNVVISGRDAKLPKRASFDASDGHMRSIVLLLRVRIADLELEAAGTPEAKSLLEEIAVIDAAFDKEFYRRTYTDIQESGADPLRHYTHFGWREGRDPTPDFSTQGYMTAHPELAESGENPFAHYLRTISVKPKTTPTVLSTDEATTYSSRQIFDFAGEFDTQFYLGKYPDVAKSGQNALEHFHAFGWRENRDPNADFSTQFYRDSYPDIVKAGINPFWHYVVRGRQEGRLSRHPGGDKAKALLDGLSLEETVAAWKRKGAPEVESLRSARQILDSILEAMQGVSTKLVISIGHDDYRKGVGGVQYCIQVEEEVCSKADITYLHLYPWQYLPRLASNEDDPDPTVVLRLNGSEIGHCPTSVVTEALAMIANEPVTTRVVIHHLLGHSIERIAELVKVSSGGECWFWLHDYFSLCPSYALQRNGISYCGAPVVGSNACIVCLYGEERRRHLERFAAFFAKLSVHILAPSQVSLDLWQAKTSLHPSSVQVAPHLQFKRTRARVPKPVNTSAKISVAFAGTAAPHKGWPTFGRLVRTYGNDARYHFIYFGATAPNIGGVEHVPVRVTAESPKAMINAIAESEVDIVLHWASWPETFSFSTYEAVLGGSAVLTNAISGNVARAVEKTKCGLVLSGEDELIDFFASEGAVLLATRIREQRAKSVLKGVTSRMSIPYLFEGAK